MTNFDGRSALVTGASTGLGETIAAELVSRGARVILSGRHVEAIHAAAERIDPSGRNAVPFVADVRDPDAGRSTVEEAVSRFGGLHLAVNNAGVTGSPARISDIDVDEWSDVLETNLSGVFFGLKYQLPAIARSGGGAIVNLSSANGVVGLPGLAAYTAAKHGVVGLTRSAALEFATEGVRVNCIGPGYVDTPRIRGSGAETLRFMAAQHPMKRLATREEVAKLVCFLLSAESSFVTGAFYAMDGGYTAQ